MDPNQQLAKQLNSWTKKNRRKPAIPFDRIQIEEGRELAAKLHLHDWDFIAAGDGSATTWENAAGFGSILYCRKTGEHRKFFGGCSNATNNVAEMMAVLEPLLFIEGTIRLKDWKPNVYVISDSEYVVHTGNGVYEQKSNKTLWAAVEHLRTKMNLIFRHVNRMLLPANIFGDQIGNAVRIYLNDTMKQLKNQ
jgi:ribonuclease HI